MAYTYHDYVTYADGTAKLARLRQHIQEVALQNGPSVGAHGYNRDANNVTQYLAQLKAEERDLAAAVGTVNGGVSVARFVEPA